MAKTFTDFSNDTVGNTPSGFSLLWGSNTTLEVVDNGGVNEASLTVTSANRVMWKWDDVGIIDKSELYVQFRANNQFVEQLRSCLRGGGTAGSEDVLRSAVDEGTSLLKISKYVNGANSTITDDTSHPQVDDGEIWNIRTRVIDGRIRTKTWQDGTPEPESYPIDTVDADFGSGGIESGYVGIGIFNAYTDLRILKIGAGSDGDEAPTEPPKEPKQYHPFAEFVEEYDGYSGNPYDVVVKVTFTHTATSETAETEMFYDGDWDYNTGTKGTIDLWKWRLLADKTGEWTYVTQADGLDGTDNITELDGLTGSIDISAQDAGDEEFARGTPLQRPSTQKWQWAGSEEVFVPNLTQVGYAVPLYNSDESLMDDDVTEFLDETGFKGFNMQVNYGWFDPTTRFFADVSNNTSSDLSPSPRTFEVIEKFLLKVYEGGGFVHFLEWGDEANDTDGDPRDMNGGVNGGVHQRLQRYISARLGAIPGWTIGFGFDVSEVATGAELETWHSYYHSKLGWDHVIGARVTDNDDDTANVLTDQLDYIGAGDHATINYDDGSGFSEAYDRFLEWLNAYTSLIHFSEDKFRGGGYDGGSFPSREFSDERLRRTLWHSSLVGTMAAIYGYADVNGDWDQAFHRSFPFGNKNEFKIFADFWDAYQENDYTRDNTLTNDYALKRTGRIIAYRENASSVDIDLSAFSSITKAVSVQTTDTSYTETDISGDLTAGQNNTWTAPSTDDWVLMVEGEEGVDPNEVTGTITGSGELVGITESPDVAPNEVVGTLSGNGELSGITEAPDIAPNEVVGTLAGNGELAGITQAPVVGDAEVVGTISGGGEMAGITEAPAIAPNEVIGVISENGELAGITEAPVPGEHAVTGLITGGGELAGITEAPAIEPNEVTGLITGGGELLGITRNSIPDFSEPIPDERIITLNKEHRFIELHPPNRFIQLN